MGTLAAALHTLIATAPHAGARVLLLGLLGGLALSTAAGALDLPGAVAPGPGAAGWSVVLFACHDCPICTASMPEVQRIADDYAGRGVAVSVVLEDEDLSPQGVLDWAAAYCPRLQPVTDPGRARARALQAHCTPEVVVLGADGQVRYRGRIDDTWVALGRARPAPTSHDLREALDALLAGRPVPCPATQTVGCVIDFEQRKAP